MNRQFWKFARGNYYTIMLLLFHATDDQICSILERFDSVVYSIEFSSKSNASWEGRFINKSIIISAWIDGYQGLAPVPSIWNISVKGVRMRGPAAPRGRARRSTTETERWEALAAREGRRNKNGCCCSYLHLYFSRIFW